MSDPRPAPAPKPEKRLRDATIARWGALKTARSSWWPHWKDISDYMLPRRGRFLWTEANRGDKLNDKIVDSTAQLAIRTLAAGMQAGITSPARTWFLVETEDSELMDLASVRVWCETVQERMYSVLNRSNFYQGMHGLYEELGTFGTGAICLLEDRQDTIRCYPYTIGQYAIGNNSRLEVDVFYRDYAMTVAQLVEEFGYENCSSHVQSMWLTGATEQQIPVLHAIEPNDKRILDNPFTEGMPYRELHIEVGGAAPPGQEDRFLRRTGYNEFPVLVARWNTTGEDVYGRSPGMDALPVTKQLRHAIIRRAEAADFVNRPPMVADQSMANRDTSLIPGGTTYAGVTGGQKRPFEPAYQINPDMQGMNLIVEELRAEINRAFYADLFLMLSQSDRREITAREIAERHEEKLIALGPMLERHNHEVLDPAITRTFNIMARMNLLPPPEETPVELQGQPLRIKYVGLLAQAQRMVGIGALEATARFTAGVAAIDPRAVDKFDADEAIDSFARAAGTPARVVRGDDAVAELRAARAQQEQMQQAAMMAQQGADVAATAAKADTGGRNLLTDMINLSQGRRPGPPGQEARQ